MFGIAQFGAPQFAQATLSTDASLTDTETVTLTDAGENIAFSAADTATFTDAGESVTNAVTDADIAAFLETEAINAALSDSDVGVLADGGENVSSPGSPADSDTGSFTDGGEGILVSLTDDDPATFVDAGEDFRLAGIADTATFVDAGETAAVDLTSSDTGGSAEGWTVVRPSGSDADATGPGVTLRTQVDVTFGTQQGIAVLNDRRITLND